MLSISAVCCIVVHSCYIGTRYLVKVRFPYLSVCYGHDEGGPNATRGRPLAVVPSREIHR